MQAIATAKSWLSNKPALERLSQLTKVRRLHDQLDELLKVWENQPLVISFKENPAPVGFEARVAQYDCHSMNELEGKLSQFPAGTKFLLSTPPMNSPGNGRSLVDLNTFLSSHGMIVAGEKRED